MLESSKIGHQQTEEPQTIKETIKAWECGSSEYNSSLPNPKNDPWAQLLGPRQERDKARCKAWKEEVQNLLIFAGLFSAVVTAFVIELQKTLRTDPIDVVLPLLMTKIGDVQASQVLNGVFSLPEASSVRINTLWFLSLVLSLVTVLVGIVSLQWLREHQRPYGDLEPQIAFSIHRMNEESLDKWWVPQIFTMLPLLLQVALVLFFIGLIELLFNLNRTVAIWVTTAIGLALFFLGATTILPTLQNLCLFLPWRLAEEPPSPCPYKSPQAWAFHRLLCPLVKVVMKRFDHSFDKYLKIDSTNLTFANGRGAWFEPMPRGIKLLYRNKLKDTWLEHSVAWLFQRDLEYMKLDTETNSAARPLAQRPIPLYDAVQGVLEAKHEAFWHTDFTPVDHCIASIVTANVGVNQPYARFLHRLSLNQPLGFGIPPGFEPSHEYHDLVLQEDATLRLFSRNTSFDNFPPEAIGRCIEICVRLTAWMYGDQKHGDPYYTPQELESIDHWHATHSLPIQWVAHTLEKYPLELDFTQAVRQQIRLIVLRFFERPKTWYYPADSGKSFNTNKCLGRFLSSAAKILTRDGDYGICHEILECIRARQGRDDAYQAAYIFCCPILETHQGRSITSPSLRGLVESLYQYEKSGNPLPSSSTVRWPAGLLKGLSYHEWEKFTRRAKTLGVQLDFPEETLGESETSCTSLTDGAERPAHSIVDILLPGSLQ